MNWKTYRKTALTKMVEVTQGMFDGSIGLPPDCGIHNGALVIRTAEGDTLSCGVGDMIAEGVKGEHYPIGREYFEATYKEA